MRICIYIKFLYARIYIILTYTYIYLDIYVYINEHTYTYTCMYYICIRYMQIVRIEYFLIYLHKQYKPIYRVKELQHRKVYNG